MQTLKIDGTTYRVKFDRDPLELAKLARKPYKLVKFKDFRKFPKALPGTISTANYFRTFENLNYLTSVKYDNLDDSGTAQYDPTIPLCEVIE